MKLWIALFLLVMPAWCFADLRVVGEPVPPPTAADVHNAGVSLMMAWSWAVIASVALAWIVWWGVRMRRRCQALTA